MISEQVKKKVTRAMNSIIRSPIKIFGVLEEGKGIGSHAKRIQI
jgi:hypothetical protein